MKRTIIAVVLLGAILLSGCNRIFDGRYSSVTPHSMPSEIPTVQEKYTAKDRDELYAVVERLVHNGLTGATIDVSAYDQNQLDEDGRWVTETALKNDPIAAYAVDRIDFDRHIGASKPSLSVTVNYREDRSQVRGIQYVNNTQTAAAVIRQALDRCDGGVVMYIHDYAPTDFERIVTEYAQTMPNMVMELPQVSVGIYPEQGTTRVVELQLRYQTDRATLLRMQEAVQPVFESAKLYISGTAEPIQEYDQLASFLMRRFDYQIATSATPIYSLLCQGVGDSRAFAVVYAAMCRQSGLKSMVVSGEKNGQSHAWNMVAIDGYYYHVDLMEPEFVLRTDAQMEGYGWEEENYPVCAGPQVERITQ